jgi:L-alanine-DL-glutamate epimerase-like enolase superfamily enzyme
MTALRVTRAIVRRLDLPFRRSFRQATHERRSSESLVLELHLDSGLVGYGECLPRGYVGGASIDGTLAEIRRLIGLFGETFPTSLDELTTLLDRAHGDANANNARCALELAALDAYARVREQSVLACLGGARFGEIRYTGVIPADGPEAIAAIATKMRAAGLTSYKCKVGVDESQDLASLTSLRSAVGEAEIRVDANGSWTFEEAKRRLMAYDQLGIVAVEQPLAPELDGELPALASAAGRVKIVADESVIRRGDVRRLGAARAVHGINIKIAKVGGLVPALRLHAEAREHGLFSQLGAHVGETSIATAAGLTFAALVDDLRWHEGAFGLHLLEHDITSDPISFGPGGMLPVQSVAGVSGLGVEVDREVLTRCTVESVSLL